MGIFDFFRKKEKKVVVEEKKVRPTYMDEYFIFDKDYAALDSEEDFLEWLPNFSYMRSEEARYSNLDNLENPKLLAFIEELSQIYPPNNINIGATKEELENRNLEYYDSTKYLIDYNGVYVLINSGAGDYDNIISECAFKQDLYVYDNSITIWKKDGSIDIYEL